MTYNYAALTMVVTPEMIRQYRVSLSDTPDRAEVWGEKISSYFFYGMIAIVCAAFVVSLFGAIVANTFIETLPAIAGSLVAVILLLVVKFALKAYQTALWTKRIRMNTFAEDNQLLYTERVTDPQVEGMFFDIGHSRVATDIVSGRQGTMPFEMADYTYVTGSGKNSVTHTLSYIRVQLERHLPHMVLDAVGNNTKLFGLSTSNLPVVFQKDQTIRLEGNFNDYFHLYAPEEYGTDARYVFTPDLMALFMDMLAVYDAEIIDNQLLVYSSSKIAYTDVAFMQHVFKIIETVGEKTLNRTDRYRDERSAVTQPDVVAVQGRRLKKSSLPTILIIVGVLLFALFQLYISSR